MCEKRVGCRKVCECVGCRTGAASHAKEGGRHKDRHDKLRLPHKRKNKKRKPAELNNKERHAASLSPTHTPFFTCIHTSSLSPPFLSYLRALHPQPNRVPRHITRITREQQNTHAAKQNTDKFSLAFFLLYLLFLISFVSFWFGPGSSLAALMS